MKQPPSNAKEIPVLPAYLTAELTRCLHCRRIVAADGDTVSEYAILVFKANPEIKQALCRMCRNNFNIRSSYVGESRSWTMGETKLPEPV